MRTSLWIAFSLGILLLSRAPALLCPFELDRDESQMAAQAMRYERDLTPWRSVEGETNGPLDSWVPLAAHLAGMPYSYPALHLLAAVCLAGTLLATAAAIRSLFGTEAALCGLAAGACWLAFSPVEGLVHYSSELVPVLLLSAGVALAARARVQADAPGWVSGGAAGLLLGLVPWAKLQAGPVALALGAWALAGALRRGRKRYSAGLIAGAAAPTALFLAWLAAAGATEEFWRTYILGGLYHGRSRPWSEDLRDATDLLLWNPASPWFWDAALLVAAALAIGLYSRRRSGGSAPSSLPASPGRWLGPVWLAAALFAALRPVTQWTHYALFCLAPLMAIAAAAVQALRSLAPRRPAGWAIVLGLTPLPAAHFLAYHYPNAAAAMLFPRESGAFNGQMFLAAAVRRVEPHPASLAVWGWSPSLYVDLGVAPATRSAVNAFLTDPANPSCALLRGAFIDDLRRSRPEMIVDTEDYVFRGRRKTAPETFPELAGYLRDNYVLAGKFAASRTADYSLVVDVYLRR